MSRVFKGSKFKLKLFIPNAYKVSNLKISLYTTDYQLAYEVPDELTVDGDIVSFIVNGEYLHNMNDGIINYIAKGDDFLIERQSNYYLKNPSAVGGSDLIEITEVFPLNTTIFSLINKDLNVDGFSKVTIDATDALNAEHEKGLIEGKEEGIVEGYNNGYAVGNTEGFSSGYTQGFEEGVADQKSKLEDIVIIENGVYTNENGFGEISVEVPSEEAAELISANFEVNGEYYPHYQYDNTIKVKNTAFYLSDIINIDREYTAIQLWFMLPEDYLSKRGTLFGTKNGTNEATTLRAYYEGDKMYLQLGEYTQEFIIEKKYGRILSVEIAFNSSIFILSFRRGISNIFARDYISNINFTPTHNLPIYIGAFCNNGNVEDAFEGHIIKGIYANMNNGTMEFNPLWDDNLHINDNVLNKKIVDETQESLVLNEVIDYTYDGFEAVLVSVDTQTPYDDGYEQGYNEGSTNTKNEIYSKAEVITITKNGKYVVGVEGDDVVKGVFDDGTEFKNYALLTDTAFDTGIFTDENTKVEIWYKATDMADTYGVIFGAQSGDDSEDTYQLRHCYSGDEYWAKIGLNGEVAYPDYNREWHHFEMSYAEGFKVDGLLYQNFTDFGCPNITGCPNTLLINGIKNMDETRCANGYFGMVKINGQIFIPTEDGFKNYETGELLERFFDGGYEYYEHNEDVKPEVIYENLIKEINVNVTAESNAQSDVLEVTENGVYITPYTQEGDYEVANQTGIFNDNTPFFGYADLNEIAYDTGIRPSSTTKLEVWWKNDSISPTTTIIGAQGDDVEHIFKIQEASSSDGELYAEIRQFGLYYSEYEKHKWNHIKMSYADGLWVNDVKVDDFGVNMDDEATNTILINSNNTWYEGSANGRYGMIKIDDQIIIPTEEGFKNITTGELLQVIKEGTYSYNEYTPTNVTLGENLYRTIKVNVTDPSTNCDEAYDEGFAVGYEYGNEFGYNRGHEDGFSNGYGSGYGDGENYVIDNLQSLTITKSGHYTPQMFNTDYFYMDDDKFPVCTYSDVGCFRVKFKISNDAGCVIFGDESSSVGIFMIGNSRIKIRWCEHEGEFEVDPYEWNTVDVLLGSVIVNGVQHTISNIGQSVGIYGEQLYLGANYTDGSVFNFNSLKVWQNSEDYYSENTPDYYAFPYDYRLGITPKDGETYYVENSNEGSSTGKETEGNELKGWDEVYVNINDKTKLPNGIKFSDSSIVGDFPDIFDFSEVTNFASMFSTITGMTSIPKIETSNATTMAAMFEYCRFLNEVPMMNTENVKSMYYMFRECDKITTIPKFITSNVTNFEGMFYGCENLEVVPQLDTSKATSFHNTFFGCSKITSLPALDATSVTNGNNISSGLDNLVTFGGWQNLRTTAYVSNLKKLSYNSVVNIIDGLYDFEKTYAVQTLYVSAEFIETASGNISRATRKGWEIREW
jgi:surface protein